MLTWAPRTRARRMLPWNKKSWIYLQIEGSELRPAAGAVHADLGAAHVGAAHAAAAHQPRGQAPAQGAAHRLGGALRALRAAQEVRRRMATRAHARWGCDVGMMSTDREQAFISKEFMSASLWCEDMLWMPCQGTAWQGPGKAGRPAQPSPSL